MLFDELSIKDTISMPCLNTGTPLDYILGFYEQGLKGEYYLNSGLSPMSAFSGRGGCYKSTTVDSIISNVLRIYPDSTCLKLDTENNSFGKTRFTDMGGDEVSSRIVVKKSSELSQEEFLKMLDGIVEHKINHKKDYLVETPFIDMNTGKALMMFKPTIIDIDSFTLFRSTIETKDEVLHDVASSDRNMDDMTDGRIKRKILMQFSKLASKAGIYFTLIAQTGNNMSLTHMPPSKQIQHMAQKDRLKGVSDMFTFLTNTLIQFNAPSKILASDHKSPEYPDDTATGDLNQVSTSILRCKTAGDGINVPLVVSQSRGIQTGLTNYHLLKGEKEVNTWGLEKKGHNRYIGLMPDVALHRNSIIQLLQDNPQLNRALEIMAQIHWMNMNWNTKNFPVQLPTNAQEFYEKLDKKTTLRDDILNSRGYWTYNKKDPKKYMSIIDIINLVNKG